VGVAVALTAVDLLIAPWGFNPASDPALLDFTPPAIQWLQGQPGHWRFTTLDDPSRPPLMNANMGWRYGLDDIRGYESIIPMQYVDYMRELAPQGQLPYNRVAPLYTADDYNHFGGYHRALDSRLFDLLNVRYVVTYKDTQVYFREWKLVYEDAAVRIWENDSAVPRAYTVPPDDATLFATPAELAVPIAPRPTLETFREATIVSDSGREQTIDVNIDAESYLVVSQSYFPGWRAFIRPQGADESAETPLTVERVQGNFQGVRLPEAGAWTVRLVYSPQSFQVGAFGTFISAVVILFGVGVWAWRLFVGVPNDTGSGISRVARNSLAPIILNLFNRGIDFAFAIVMLRILGPEGSGIYTYAAIVFGWFDIFTNFGLNLFLTREVARNRAAAGRYLLNTSALRLILAAVGVPLLVAFLAARQATVTPALTGEALLAIALLYIGLVPNSLSTGLSALFYAFERAEIPAAIATVATISKTVFGLAALLAGWGVVGLAAVSIFTNLITLLVMAVNARGLTSIPSAPVERGENAEGQQAASVQKRLMGGSRVEPPLMRRMVGESWPLMLNHFLASIFFQIDIVLIEAMHGARMVGQYGVAYKWVLALNVIPAFFTQALLPVMARQAHEDRAGLTRNYQLAIKLLVSVAFPTAVLFTFLAYPLTSLLGGAEFLPDGAIALQLMIWSIPIGWMNSLTQYVLVALDAQRRITRAFALGVGFNLVTNFIFIPAYGYRAAALTTIASEAVLFAAFALLLAREGVRPNWRDLIWRAAVAAGAMFAVLWVGWDGTPLLSGVMAVIVYIGVLLVLRPLNGEEVARLRPLLPRRRQRARVAQS
jgi:O-antigen/teichoic acid export membrane protein